MSTDPADPAAGTVMDGLPLTDHHCHGVVGTALDRDGFEALATESNWPGPAGTSMFDSQLGFAIRRWCAPLLDLEPHAAAEDYLARRLELGPDAVNRRLLGAAGLGTLLVDTGYRAGELTSPAQTAALAGGIGREIVRLEHVAEQVAAETTPSSFGADFAQALGLAARDAAGFKSVAAYRCGLDFDPSPPPARELERAAARWLGRPGSAGAVPRLADPVLLRHLLWTALELGKPIQFHTGYGDAELDLHRCNPLLLTGWLRATRAAGVPMMLLHCYPYHREAGYLAQVFPHVYVDVGLAVNHTGSRSPAVIAELLELTPFHKALFSTDAIGLPELHYLGAALFRRGFGQAAERWVDGGDWSVQDARRVASLIGCRNAARVYGLES
ncbi:amidohydrolase family protein [Arthrobacter sp. I2-34]|uniref:Amidohydrolase family protein n=1 Tax=Arthrobacter hankyongi TaxID=2904801 RepID=A0ABS9L4K8_9MICC|nr:amidohydrolase family protein [Arthrobacter hankyongi]MCG2621483.1 amidohydrolase family protein [Arthrobacter hankyongi]